jgi:penicillin-binding protein 2
MKIICECIRLEKDDQQKIDESKKSPFIVIKDKLSWEEYAKLSMNLFKLNGVSLESIHVRNYPMTFECSHVVGHTKNNGHNLPILEGKTGIEAYLNDKLIGESGNTQVEVNAQGKRIRIIDSEEPVAGMDVVLTIDSRLQKYVYDLLAQERAATAVVLDISNGEILAMVSFPAFNANLISAKMTQAQWQSVIQDPLFPLLNRAVNCSYPPGSIFKIVVAFAALEEKIITPQDKIFCGGGIKVDDTVFHCWNRGGHGHVNLFEALRFSCDCYFFEVSRKLGIDNIVKYAKRFGFGEETGVELPSEHVGLLPTKKWKFLSYGTHWKPYETMIAGIGQGALLATLLQLAVMFGKIYTRNYEFIPTLVRDQGKKSRRANPISEQSLNIIIEALRQVCSCGTAAGSCRTTYGISGKTGSSQVSKIQPTEVGRSPQNIPWKLRDHAIFVGCAPNEHPRYVVAVLVEHGGGGAAVAAPIARKIFDRIMENEKIVSQ